MNKKINIKQFISDYYPVLVFLIIMIVTQIPVILNNKGLMIFYGDSYEQQLQFYFGGWERIRNLDFSQWDWSLGYGANYFSHIFYFATSPFFILSTLFEKSNLPYLFIYLNALKLCFIYGFTYLWLSQISSSRLTRTIGSLVLTFSGWVIFYYHYNHFLDAFLFYPLILYGIELFLQKNKILYYTLFIALLGIVNYYFLYMFIFFIFLYTILRYFTLNQKFDFKHLSKSILLMLFYSILGIGMSAIILFPSVSIILNTPRIQGLGNQNWFETLSIINSYRYFSTLFSPVIQRFDPSVFISTSFNQGIGWGGGTSIYSSILFPIAFLTYIFSAAKKEKYLILGCYTILITLLFFTSSYRILQGSMDVRWYYMFTIMNVYLITRFLDQIDFKLIPSYKKIIPIFINIFVILVISFISINKGYYLKPSHLDILIRVAGISILINILFLLLNKKNYFKSFLLLVITVESCISFLLPITIDVPIEAEVLKTYVEPTLNRSAIEYIEDIDDGFYRIMGDSGLYTSQNDPFARYYRGTSFYESIYNFEQDLFLDRFKSTWSMPVTFGRTNTNFITSVKYFLSQGNHYPPFGFEFLTEIDGVSIYINRYFINLGFSSSNTLNEETFKQLTFLNQDRLFLNYIVTKNSDNSSFEYLNNLEVYSEWVFDERYYLNIGTELKDLIIYIENFDIPVFSVNRIKDENLEFSENFWQYNYFSVYFDNLSKTNAVEIFKDNIYSSPSGYNIYFDKDLVYYDEWYKQVSSSMFYDVEILKDTISAKINLTEKQWVFTSIPYDKGWSVRLNGKEIDFEKVNLGFIGFEIEKGEHTLEFSYVSPGFKLGSLVSGISLLIYLIIVYLTKSKRINA